MLCRRMRLTERHLQPPREPLEGPIVRPCTARKLMNLDTGTVGTASMASSPHNAISHATITIPTGDATGTASEGQQFSPRGSKGDPERTDYLRITCSEKHSVTSLRSIGFVISFLFGIICTVSFRTIREPGTFTRFRSTGSNIHRSIPFWGSTVKGFCACSAGGVSKHSWQCQNCVPYQRTTLGKGVKALQRAAGALIWKPNECPKTPLMIVNLNIPPGTETLAPKSASRTERHKLPPFCVQNRNLARFCSAPAGVGVATSGGPGTPHVLGANGGGAGATIPQIFIQSFELQDRRAADGQGSAAADGQPGSQQYNIITENDEDTFATLLLDNISNISLEMIQRHQQKLLGTTGSSLTDGQLLTGASGASGGTGFQHAEGCSSMDRTESKTSTDGALALDMRMDSTEERFGTSQEADGRRTEASAGHRRTAAVQDDGDEQLTDIPPGYRSLCYRTPSPKTRQIIRVDIVTSREKY